MFIGQDRRVAILAQVNPFDLLLGMRIAVAETKPRSLECDSEFKPRAHLGDPLNRAAAPIGGHQRQPRRSILLRHLKKVPVEAVVVRRNAGTLVFGLRSELHADLENPLFRGDPLRHQARGAPPVRRLTAADAQVRRPGGEAEPVRVRVAAEGVPARVQFRRFEVVASVGAGPGMRFQRGRLDLHRGGRVLDSGPARIPLDLRHRGLSSEHAAARHVALAGVRRRARFDLGVRP